MKSCDYTNNLHNKNFYLIIMWGEFVSEVTTMWGEFVSLIEEFWTSVFNFNATCGIVVGIIVLVFEIKCLNKFKRIDKRKEEALKRGHAIRAKRIRMWNDWEPDSGGGSSFSATYEYVVNEKRYIYRYLGAAFPAIEITVYYKNNPKRAWSDLERRDSIFTLFVYLLPLAAAVVVILLLGGV